MALRSCRLPWGLLLPLLLTGCGFSFRPAPSPPPVAVDQVPNAVPRAEPLSKYGNPDSYVAEGRRYYVLKSADGFVERGIASWYGPDFHGKRTSSGEIYDMYQMTAAHKTLPIPAYIEVTNLQTGQRAVVKVNDRGPFKDNRIIDLSYVAARKLGIWAQGTGLVEIRTLIPGGEPAGATAAAATTPTPASTAKVPVKISGAPVPFYIQVGAFIDRGNADRLRARVQVLAPNVQIAPGESNGQAIYRVQIGPLTDVDASDRIVHALVQAGVDEYRIVLE